MDVFIDEDKKIDPKMPKPNSTRRLVFSATFAAISGLCLVATSFLPLRFSLLMVAAVCYTLAFNKCGIVYGILCIIVSLAISFVRPFSSAFFLTIIVFAPYSIIAFVLKPFSYLDAQKKPVKKTLIIRPIVMVIFANLVLVSIYFIVKLLAADFIDFDVLTYVARFSYVGIAVLLSIFCILFDIVFSETVIRIGRLLK